MIEKKTDYLIVGQGLAGSVLAYALMQAKQSVYVLDAHLLPSSSKVAAGIYNPVTGRKLVKTWKADTLFPFLETYYAALEKELGASFFHPTPMYRPFPNQAIKDFLTQPEAQNTFGDFGTVSLPSQMHQGIVKNELGGITTKHSGWVNLPVLLEAFQAFFTQKEVLLQHSFNIAGLDINHQQYRIDENQSINFQKIIFCEGFYGKDNPFFAWLPFSPVKGEVLTIQFNETIGLKEIINQGAFVVPLTSHTCRLGATYSWHQLDWTPTEKGREELLDKYDKLMIPRVSVLNHLAGVRPATQDRRPFLGVHPSVGSVGIFNGLGSKGVSLAPYLAQHFVDFLVNEKELDNEVNINRFASLYLGREK
ncbi:NAD(P)/FAD-dependent oxidoreductase [Flectobacillus major]|uniref:NAD(P)/FAD-dependent oxidoreductase n=1 Tax=Flectobacillus major TaxID=103 RepID=UPI0003FB8739|nr:FAD-dependent oxidoreductase [Flectobacillus major]